MRIAIPLISGSRMFVAMSVFFVPERNTARVAIAFSISVAATLRSCLAAGATIEMSPAVARADTPTLERILDLIFFLACRIGIFLSGVRINLLPFFPPLLFTCVVGVVGGTVRAMQNEMKCKMKCVCVCVYR